MHNYDLSVRDDFSVVSALLDGALYTARSEHPNYDVIIEGLRSDRPAADIADLFDISHAINTKFELLSERVSVRNGELFLDGEQVNNALARAVVRFHEEGLNFQPLVNFFERVLSNPNEHSREQLYLWLQAHDFSINDDGDIIAYKSVRTLDNGDYGSINATGKAVVNGEERSGSIRQTVGDVVTMPRGAVQHDPSVGCHTGLHAGTYDYAKAFSGDTVLTVAINPRDVVSVPTDCSAQKIRTCRYVVVDAVGKSASAQHDSALYTDEYDDIGFDDYDDDIEHDATYGADEPDEGDVEGFEGRAKHWFEDDDDNKPISFKAGDFVRAVPDDQGFTSGVGVEVGKVYKVARRDGGWVYLEGVGGGWFASRFEPAGDFRPGDKVQWHSPLDGVIDSITYTVATVLDDGRITVEHHTGSYSASSFVYAV